MSRHNEHKRELGYEEPLDESPVDVPEGWQGGLAENTGGGIICRIWRTWSPTNPDGEPGDTEYEIIYDVSEKKGVALQFYEWNESDEYFQYSGMKEVRVVDELDDHLMAEQAKDLMEEWDQETEEFDRSEEAEYEFLEEPDSDGMGARVRKVSQNGASSD